MINELEDRMQMEKVDIYDFFRMIDVGSQATA